MTAITKIKCLLVDDEPLARSVIREHCANIDFLELVGECRNAIEATQFLAHNKVDLIFLDIQMPYLSGIEFTKQVKPSQAIIFTTAYSEYAVDGFELDAIDYLVKPINFERFFKAITKAMKWLGLEGNETKETIEKETVITEKPFLYLKTSDKVVRVELDAIIAVESQGHYVRVYSFKKNYVIHQSISELEERLPSNLFIRTHRSFIVGIKHITSYNTALIETKIVKVPIGRNFKPDVLKRLQLLTV